MLPNLYERQYVLKNLRLHVLQDSYVLLYVRSYGRLYALPNLYECISKKKNS